MLEAAHWNLGVARLKLRPGAAGACACCCLQLGLVACCSAWQLPFLCVYTLLTFASQYARATDSKNAKSSASAAALLRLLFIDVRDQRASSRKALNALPFTLLRDVRRPGNG
jgi:hypothetical protein